MFLLIICVLKKITVLLAFESTYSRTRTCRTSSRGSAGFDSSGRGYYFANHQGQRPFNRRPYLAPEHYDQAYHKPPLIHLNHYNPPQSQSHLTTSRAPPEFYQEKPAQTSHVQMVSSGTIGTVDSNPISHKNSNKELDDKEKSR